MEKQLGKAKHKKLIKTNCKILPVGKNNQLCKQRMRNLFSNSSEKYLGTTHSALVNNILLLKRKTTPGCMLSCPWHAEYVKWILHHGWNWQNLSFTHVQWDSNWWEVQTSPDKLVRSWKIKEWKSGVLWSRKIQEKGGHGKNFHTGSRKKIVHP